MFGWRIKNKKKFINKYFVTILAQLKNHFRSRLCQIKPRGLTSISQPTEVNWFGENERKY